MTVRRRVRVAVWALSLVVAVMAALGHRSVVAVLALVVHVWVSIPLWGPLVQVKRDGGTWRSGLALWLVLYAPTLVRRRSHIDEQERTPGVPPLGPITVTRGWSDGAGGWWAHVLVDRDTDVERWQDMRGAILRASTFNTHGRAGEELRIIPAPPGGMKWTFFADDPLGGVRKAPVQTSTVVKVGRTEDSSPAEFDFRSATHFAWQGMTRSGKSVLGYVIVAALIGCRDVRLWGVDPNRVFLSPVAQATDPARFVLGTHPEAAADLLDKLTDHMDARIQTLEVMGIDKIEKFSPTMPIDVVILEEWPSLMRAASGDRTLKKRIESSFARLVAEGAKAGLRVCLIAQRMDASLVDGGARGQFGGRATFRVDNREAVAMLHPATDADVVDRVRTFPPGRALFWVHGQERTIQTDLLEYDEYVTRVRRDAPTVSEPSAC